MRRLTLALALVFLVNYPYFALFVMNFQMMFVVIYNGLVEPFGIFEDYMVEQISEVFIAFLVYHLFCFADGITDPDARVTMGWWMIGVMCTVLFTGLSFITFKAVLSIIGFCKLQIKRRNDRIRK
jgi:hypothetical protein